MGCGLAARSRGAEVAQRPQRPAPTRRAPIGRVRRQQRSAHGPSTRQPAGRWRACRPETGTQQSHSSREPSEQHGGPPCAYPLLRESGGLTAYARQRRRHPHRQPQPLSRSHRELASMAHWPPQKWATIFFSHQTVSQILRRDKARSAPNRVKYRHQRRPTYSAAICQGQVISSSLSLLITDFQFLFPLVPLPKLLSKIRAPQVLALSSIRLADLRRQMQSQTCDAILCGPRLQSPQQTEPRRPSQRSPSWRSRSFRRLCPDTFTCSPPSRRRMLSSVAICPEQVTLDILSGPKIRRVRRFCLVALVPTQKAKITSTQNGIRLQSP
jgi:hypothetical protein